VEILQRLQPLDVLFAVLWAAIVGWGLRTGIIRQVGMLVAVYGGALLAGSLYHQLGQALTLAFGRETLPLFEFSSYVVLFVVTFALIGLVVWRAYPSSRLSRQFGTENILGAAVGAVWGLLFLIVLLTILRYYTVVPLREQEAAQHSVLGQIQASQSAPVLQVVAAPLWNLLVPWFPSQVPPRL
jgi:uncharacterized membrane protein required for colicin V production